MEQQHYFPPLHGAVDCDKCEARDCWCRGKSQRNRRDMTPASGRCPRLPDLCGFVEKEERELYKATFMLVHAEYGGCSTSTRFWSGRPSDFSCDRES